MLTNILLTRSSGVLPGSRSLAVSSAAEALRSKDDPALATVRIVEPFSVFKTGPRTEAGLHVIVPGEKKLLVEGPSRNGQSAAEEK